MPVVEETLAEIRNASERFHCGVRPRRTRGLEQRVAEIRPGGHHDHKLRLDNLKFCPLVRLATRTHPLRRDVRRDAC